jgi:hypothetical protein
MHACMQHGDEAWICIVHMHFCSKDMQKDMQQGRVAWKYSMNMPHEHAARICSMDKQHGQASWTCSVDKQHEHAAWTRSTDMQQGHATYLVS